MAPSARSRELAVGRLFVFLAHNRRSRSKGRDVFQQVVMPFLPVYRRSSSVHRTWHWWQRKGVFWSIHISLGLRVERLRRGLLPPLPSPQFGRSPDGSAAPAVGSFPRSGCSRRCRRSARRVRQSLRQRGDRPHGGSLAARRGRGSHPPLPTHALASRRFPSVRRSGRLRFHVPRIGRASGQPRGHTEDCTRRGRSIRPEVRCLAMSGAVRRLAMGDSRASTDPDRSHRGRGVFRAVSAIHPCQPWRSGVRPYPRKANQAVHGTRRARPW